MRRIYLDYNATTPIDPVVLEAMMPWLTEKFGNAASKTHSFGWEAEAAVKIARERIAAQIGAEPEEIIFTSGSTEGINLSLKGVAELYGSKGNHIITCATEHKAVLDTCKYLEKKGIEVTYLAVDSQGLVSAEELRAMIKPETILVSIMIANNETGTIQNIEELSAIAKESGAIFMTDATQAIGKIPVSVDGIDLLCLSGHKIYGPKGVGALYIRKKSPRVALSPLMHGGGHERGFRSGTLNVPGIVGLGKAMELCSNGMQEVASLRDKLEEGLLQLGNVKVNGHVANRLPNTSNVCIEGIDADALIMAAKGVAVSTGSACTSAVMEPSHVLAAMGLSDEAAYSSIRISLGKPTTEDEVNFAVSHLSEAVSKLRSIS